MKRAISFNSITGKAEMLPEEIDRYKALKQDLIDEIDDLMAGFVRIGNILTDIRDNRLYLVEFSTFEEFCHKTLNRGRDYIYKLIASSDVVRGLVQSGMRVVDLPKNESVARMLGRFDRDERREILERANEVARRAGRGRATAADVRRQAPREELAYAQVLQDLNKCLHLLPRDIPWKDALLNNDEFCRQFVRTLLRNVLDRVVFLLASEDEKPAGSPKPKAIEDK